MESLSLATHAARWAWAVTRITGEAVESLGLGGCEPVPEVQGMTGTWWRGEDSLIAVYRGEAAGLDAVIQGRVSRRSRRGPRSSP